MCTQNWGLVSLATFECGVTEETADHVISACLIHRAPQGVAGLTVLDGNIRCWLNTSILIQAVNECLSTRKRRRRHYQLIVKMCYTSSLVE